jgi:complement component 1 Q subcomponent-binding protein
MMSLRAAARSAPRFITRSITTTALRPTSRASALLKTSSVLPTRQSTSAFSTSLLRRAPAAGETDEELSAKLGSEIEYENDVKENEPLPASIKDFLENGPFEIQDIPGTEEVTLTRKFGTEKLVFPYSRFP